jgi:hypothetical protein
MERIRFQSVKEIIEANIQSDIFEESENAILFDSISPKSEPLTIQDLFKCRMRYLLFKLIKTFKGFHPFKNADLHE